jgi:predicted MPP superfamily phosphohydrolase
VILVKHERRAAARRQPAFWRLADRLQLLLYHNGWPARLSRLLGFRPSLRIVEHDVELSTGSRDTPALTVAFASDFHAGFTTDPDLLRQACDALEVAKPDVLLLGGDFVSLDARQIDWLAPLIGRIPARLGRFAVLGNHDRWNGADHVSRSLEAVGIEVLTNRNRRLPPPFHHIWICGLDDHLSGEPDVPAALEGAEGARIVLMHAPANLLDLDGERFDLALCGHTHGGQIALLGGTPLHVALGPLSRDYNRGRFRMNHGGILVVSVGLGCTTLPIRLNSDPEIIICKIVTSPGGDRSRDDGRH